MDRWAVVLVSMMEMTSKNILYVSHILFAGKVKKPTKTVNEVASGNDFFVSFHNTNSQKG